MKFSSPGLWHHAGRPCNEVQDRSVPPCSNNYSQYPFSPPDVLRTAGLGVLRLVPGRDSLRAVAKPGQVHAIGVTVSPGHGSDVLPGPADPLRGVTSVADGAWMGAARTDAGLLPPVRAACGAVSGCGRLRLAQPRDGRAMKGEDGKAVPADPNGPVCRI